MEGEMSQDDSVMIIRYAMSIYPSMRWTDDQINQNAVVWSNEFSANTREQVIEAFKIARTESPDWLPSIPRIQSAIKFLESQLKQKSDEDEFRDAHCGKSEAEWKALTAWESSKEGASKLKEYKQRLLQIAGSKI